MGFRGTYFHLSLPWLAAVVLSAGASCPAVVPAQSLPASVPVTRGNNSESNAAYLDSIRNDALGIDGTTIPGPVIVIARLGNGETSRRLVLRRLHNVAEYLRRSLGPDRLIVAEGERVRDVGRVEFYQGGKLVWVCLIARGKDMYVDCCDKFPQYYPWYKGEPKVGL